jgi:hypothetical protein
VTQASKTAPAARFEARRDNHGGWLVHDSVYDQPALLNGQLLVGLPYLVARARSELMNKPARSNARV